MKKTILAVASIFLLASTSFGQIYKQTWKQMYDTLTGQASFYCVVNFYIGTSTNPADCYVALLGTGTVRAKEGYFDKVTCPVNSFDLECRLSTEAISRMWNDGNVGDVWTKFASSPSWSANAPTGNYITLDTNQTITAPKTDTSSFTIITTNEDGLLVYAGGIMGNTAGTFIATDSSSRALKATGGMVGGTFNGGLWGIEIAGGTWGIYDVNSTYGWYNDTQIETPVLIAYNVQADTTSLKNLIDSLMISSGVLQMQIYNLGISTGYLQSQVDSLKISTGTLEQQLQTKMSNPTTAQLDMAGFDISVGSISAKINQTGSLGFPNAFGDIRGYRFTGAILQSFSGILSMQCDLVPSNNTYDLGNITDVNYYFANAGMLNIYTTTITAPSGIDKIAITKSVAIIDGTQGAGKVFTSDANGKGSWQTPASTSGIQGQFDAVAIASTSLQNQINNVAQSTGAILGKMDNTVGVVVSTTIADGSVKQNDLAVWYSTHPIVWVVGSTDAVASSDLVNQSVDIPCPTDVQIISWCIEENTDTSGSCTVQISSRVWAGTFGEISTTRPNLTSQVVSSGTATSWTNSNVGGGGCIRMKVITASTIKKISMSLIVWKPNK